MHCQQNRHFSVPMPKIEQAVGGLCARHPSCMGAYEQSRIPVPTRLVLGENAWAPTYAGRRLAVSSRGDAPALPWHTLARIGADAGRCASIHLAPWPALTRCGSPRAWRLLPFV